MDDFDSFDEFQDEIQEETFPKASKPEENLLLESETSTDETNLWLILALIILTLIHSFSDKWIDWVSI